MSSTNIDTRSELAAVAWLADHREHLDPARANDDTVMFARKALVEVAVLVGLRAHLDPAPLAPDYQHLLDVVADVAARPSYRELVRRDRRALLLYAGVYAALRLCGREDPAFRHVLEQTVTGRFATSFERVPYRHLDLLHTLDLAGIDCAAPGIEQVLPLTLVANDPNVWELSTGDVYAITHAVFYLSDFGRRDVAWPPSTDAATVVDLLHGCLALARARADADLVGELLMCLTCLRAPLTPFESDARAWLRSWQEPDGRLEGPPGVVPQRLRDADPDWGSWATAYHTTIVGVFDALLLRVTPRAPAPPSTARPYHRPDDVARLSGTLARAAVWLERDGSHDLRATVWAARAWELAEQPGRAGDVLRHALASPDLGAAVVAAPAETVLHAAVLAARHDVTAPAALRDVCDALAAALDPADPTDTRLGSARAHLADLRGEARPPGTPAPLDLPPHPGPAPEPDGEPGDNSDTGLRDRALALAADLLSRGPRPRLTPADAAQALDVLARAGREAVESFDVALFAVVLRALPRLPRVPHRLLRDAADLLAGQQDLDGAIGAPLMDDPDERLTLQRRWTLVATTALAEAVPILARSEPTSRAAPASSPA
ncbi:DUF6895 family protein [Oerskovia sp. NPDC057915]|uniref:DUF6895 family protein n=1 Tax=Oerskovia sp. NPDC057915 TaxID=3346280 RepID=UPI0036D793C4